jgi:biopolymer transport protein ExbD/DNA-directed RNA polymerase subunit RPC12/RpoP
MSIRFECPSCSKSIVTPDRFKGREVRCPGCDIQLVVPKASQVELVVEPEPEELIPTLEPESGIEDDSVEIVELPAIHTTQPTVPLSLSPASIQPIPPTSKSKPRSIKGDHEAAEEELEWDITPMVDVAFLLLIFFMLTASFSIQKVIRTKPPQSNEPSSNAVPIETPPETEKIIIQVDEFSAYTIISQIGGTQEASSRQELVVVLKDLRVSFEEQPPQVIIQAHEDSTHGAVVGCMDAAREADFSKFQLAVVEEFD